MRKQKKHPRRSWIDEEFAGVKLGDGRMEKRLKTIARSFESCLQGSVLEASGDWAGAKGAYRFFASEIEAETLLAGHRQQTIERLGRSEVVLALQDTTVLNFTTHRATEGMGSIGANCQGNVGFFCHSTLVVDVEGRALGLLKAETYVRRDQGRKRNRGPQTPGCESRRWLNSLDICQQAAVAKPGTRIVNIGDREADFYEFAAHAHKATAQVSFVIRACYDRQSAAGAASLFSEVGQQRRGGELLVEVPRTATSKARQSKLEIRFCPVHLKVPAHWPVAEREAAPLALWIVEAREAQSELGQEGICWRLLTNLRVESLAQAIEKVQWYRQRWNIEVFHKVLKSGCAVERRQLETRARLERALMLDLVMAWRVLSLMGLGRAHPHWSAEVVLEEYQWKALHCFEQQTRKAPTAPPSLGQVMHSIAKLGGFPGRKSDGFPGPTVLWRGLRRLDDIAASYLAFGQKTCG
jgi:hypothetical protein